MAGPNGSFFKGRACTESSFLAFGAGPGSAVQTVHFLKAGLVQNRHFWVLARVRALAVIMKGRACTESSFLGFATGPGVGRSQRVLF